MRLTFISFMPPFPYPSPTKGTVMADVKPASPLKLVRTFFGLNLAQMKSEWSTPSRRATRRTSSRV